jgi:hypothetical protein
MLLVLTSLGHYGNRDPSNLAIFTIRELAMIVLDGKPVGPLKYQNWCIDSETTNEKAWEEMQPYLTGYHSSQDEEFMIERLETRGRHLYKAMQMMCKVLLAKIQTIQELDIVKNLMSSQASRVLLKLTNDLKYLQNQFVLFAYSRFTRCNDGGISGWRDCLELARSQLEKVSDVLQSEIAIVRGLAKYPESKEWKRKLHALRLLGRIEGKYDDVHYSTHLPLQTAKKNLERMVYQWDKMAVFGSQNWYSKPRDTDEESAWREFLPLLELDGFVPPNDEVEAGQSKKTTKSAEYIGNQRV